MNCEATRKMIYLFDELGAEDRDAVEQHIPSCTACSNLYKRVMEERSVIKKIRASDTLTYSPDLTNSIMAAIEKRERTPVFEAFLQIFESQPAKYALGAVSLLLISFFITESIDPSEKNAGKRSAYAALADTEKKSTLQSLPLQYVGTNKKIQSVTSALQVLREHKIAGEATIPGWIKRIKSDDK